MARAVFLDLDGTVYRGSEPCRGAQEAIDRIVRMGLPVRYLTNNSAARPIQVTEKLRGLGIPCEPGWVVTSGQVAAQTLVERNIRSVGVVGNPGLFETLAEAGLSAVPFGISEAVVVGICHTFDYAMLQAAADAIRGGAAFLATNADKTYPFEGNRFAPGAGAIVAAVEAASGIPPEIVGKPSPAMAAWAAHSLGVEPSEAVFAGDRPDTDIQSALNAGCLPWLVLTGVTSSPVQGFMGSPTLAGLADYLERNS
ncbi:MAG: HAD-IIA family hydrolase [Armatimonadetes bacterium]|nr:HAD-IIA family hydrolase [Armatimonadota bacterium]MBX3108252.1 HAD-IIA family hydrolase [Fimbriimonadaceae bacterium]